MAQLVIISPVGMGGASDVNAIGTALRTLSDVHAAGNLVEAEMEPVDSLTLAYRGATEADGKKAVQTIGDKLAIAKIERNAAGGWSRHPPVIGSADDIAANITVRFVFEKEDEMIIVVPYKDTLDYGLYEGTVQDPPTPGVPSSPPMSEAEYVKQLPEVREALKELLEETIAGLSSDPASHDEIRTKGEAIIDNISAEPDADGRKDLFIQQLGAYSIRQCG